MFSTIRQGNSVYILDKTDTPLVKIGEVSNVQSSQLSSTGTYSINPTINLKVKVDGAVYDYCNIPGDATSVTYNNGNIVLSETRQGLQTEVESLLQNSRNVINNIDKYKSNIDACENILKDLNPQFAKDKARDEKIDKLENKLDKLLEIFNKQNKTI